MSDPESEKAILPFQPLDTDKDAAKHLEEISMNMMELLNQRDWDHELWQHFSPAFRDPLAKLEDVESLDSLIRMMKFMIKTNPKYHIQPISANAKVDERREMATVWMVLRISGTPNGIEYEGISCFWWRIVGGRW